MAQDPMAQGMARRLETSRHDEVDPTDPSADPRWAPVASVLRRYGQQPQALIEGMHAAQRAFGFLAPATLRSLADTLGVPLATVYGVATFYHLFTLQPPGTHSCVVCLGTACHLDGGPAILAALVEAHDLEPGKTSPSGELSLSVARCIGACSLAPLVVLDGEIVGRVTPEATLERVSSWFDTPPGGIGS